MLLTQHQIALIVGILLEVPSTFGLCVWATYYSFQAIANIKPNSPYRWGTPWSWQLVENAWKFKSIPGSEFTELGLWYRRRAFIAGTIFVLWSFVLIVVNAVALS
jgi:hypothetical protein